MVAEPVVTKAVWAKPVVSRAVAKPVFRSLVA